MTLFMFSVLVQPLPTIELYSLTESTAMVPDEVRIYKTAGGRELELYFFLPETAVETPSAALVAIHGGGWGSGTPNQFFPHCRYFAQRGIPAFSVQYRLKNSTQGTTIYDCIADTSDAVGFVRSIADELNIDTNRIAVIGDSAGGHLAACTGTFAADTNRANAVINCNGIMDMTDPKWRDNVPEGTVEAQMAISPLHQVTPNSAPMIHIHSIVDPTVDFAHAVAMNTALTNAGVRSEIHPLQDALHAFILPGYSATQEQIVEGLTAADHFLESLGYLSGEPSIRVTTLTNPPPTTLVNEPTVSTLPFEYETTSPSVTITNKFKLNAKTGSLVARKSFLGFTKRGFNLYFQGSSLRMAAFGTTQTLTADIPLNTWHTLMLSVGNGTASLKIDGIPVPLGAVTFAYPQEGRYLSIGEGLSGEVSNLSISVP